MQPFKILVFFSLSLSAYFGSKEPALCLPTKSELQQPSGLSEEHCCESTVHGRRGPQSSLSGELHSGIMKQHDRNVLWQMKSQPQRKA